MNQRCLFFSTTFLVIFMMLISSTIYSGELSRTFNLLTINVRDLSVLLTATRNEIYKKMLDDNENQTHNFGTRIESAATNHTINGKPLLILDWTTFYGKLMIDYWRPKTCEENRCVVTSDRKKLPNAAAVLFHGRNLNKKVMPTMRNPRQSFVFFNVESPHHTVVCHALITRILSRFYRVVNLPTSEKPKTDAEFLEVAKKKTKMAAWFVSNCGTPSKREAFVKSLKSVLPKDSVEIFGGCGSHKCPYRAEQCDKRLNTEYKFYFSLENSVCHNYVSEKFARVRYNVVPLVLRGKDYRDLGVPDDSYIAADSFRNVSELAQRLLYLHSHPEEYVKYLRWHNQGHVIDRGYLSSNTGLCQLCKVLHEIEDGKRQRKSVPNIHKWWNDQVKGHCEGNFGLNMYKKHS